MNLYRVYPETSQVTIEPDGENQELTAWFAPQPGSLLRWALVSTPAGVVTDDQGHSAGLSNPIDRAVLRVLRHHADAVITGANTVRAEPVPVPAHAPLIIVTRSGDLSGHQITAASLRSDSVIIATAHPESQPEQHFPDGVATSIGLAREDMIAPGDILEELGSRGYRSLLLEGGLTLGRAFLETGAIDELTLTLTTAPRVDSHPPLPWWDERWGQWEASAVFTDDARYLYTRYHRP